MTDRCADPNFCRNGCCRSFLGRQFCDVQSNCFTSPTWLIILIPVVLGISALILVIITMIRLKNRQVTRQKFVVNRPKQRDELQQHYNPDTNRQIFSVQHARSSIIRSSS